MNQKQKGGSFEREICTALSLWWTNGERDDVFWRSSSSGGRATQRAKKDKNTFGQYGDIQATDPIGQPLLDLFTIELKRGYSKNSVFNLVDGTDKVWEGFIKQVRRDSELADSPSWLIISKRDRREILVVMPHCTYVDIFNEDEEDVYAGIFNDKYELSIVDISTFFKNVKPERIKEYVRELQ